MGCNHFLQGEDPNEQFLIAINNDKTQYHVVNGIYGIDVTTTDGVTTVSGIRLRGSYGYEEHVADITIYDYYSSRNDVSTLNIIGDISQIVRLPDINLFDLGSSISVMNSTILGMVYVIDSNNIPLGEISTGNSASYTRTSVASLGWYRERANMEFHSEAVMVIENNDPETHVIDGLVNTIIYLPVPGAGVNIGKTFNIINRSQGLVTVKAFNGDVVNKISPGSTVSYTCINAANVSADGWLSDGSSTDYHEASSNQILMNSSSSDNQFINANSLFLETQIILLPNVDIGIDITKTFTIINNTNELIEVRSYTDIFMTRISPGEDKSFICISNIPADGVEWFFSTNDYEAIVTNNIDLNLNSSFKSHLLFTGTANETLILPQLPHGLEIGFVWTINNYSIGTITVKSFDGTILNLIPPKQIRTYTLISNTGDTPSSWFYIPLSQKTYTTSGVSIQLDSSSVEDQLIFNGTSDQTILLPDSTIDGLFIGKRFEIINNSTGNVFVASTAGIRQVLIPKQRSEFILISQTITDGWFCDKINFISRTTSLIGVSLDSESCHIQRFTGTIAQTINLPPYGNGIILGDYYLIINESNQNIRVNSDGGTQLDLILPNCSKYFYYVQASSGISAWFSTFTDVNKCKGILSSVNGGTGLNNPAEFNVLSGGNTTTLNVIPPLTSEYVLTSNGASSQPSFKKIKLDSSTIDTILPVPQGGTGLASLDNDALIIGNGSSPPTFVGPGTTGYTLQTLGSGPPQWKKNISNPNDPDADAVDPEHGGTGATDPVPTGTGKNVLNSGPSLFDTLLNGITSLAGIGAGIFIGGEGALQGALIGAGAIVGANLVSAIIDKLTSSSTPDQLSNEDAQQQNYTGYENQNVLLPDTVTLPLGFPFTIINSGLGQITVKSYDGTFMSLVTPGSSQVFTVAQKTGGSSVTRSPQGWRTILVDLQTQVTNVLPISNGGTGVTIASQSPSGNSFAVWNNESNILANNFITPLEQTLSSPGGNTTLTAHNSREQIFSGINSQLVTLPNVTASNIFVGMKYEIVNITTALLTVRTFDSSQLCVLRQQTRILVTCISKSNNSADSWLLI